MKHQENREFVSQELQKLKEDVDDPNYRKLWVDYHDLIMSLPDEFFTIRPHITIDGFLSWSDVGRFGTARLPRITYRIHHPIEDKGVPTLEVLFELETPHKGIAQFAMWSYRVMNGKYHDVILLDHIKNKFVEWQFEQL